MDDLANDASNALTFLDAVKIARGCLDYGGGYRHNGEMLAIYHNGIKTVIKVLQNTFDKGLDTQSAALHFLGGENGLANTVQIIREALGLPAESANGGNDLLNAISAVCQMREALELIATPRRPDGTWNRNREACRQIAVQALEAMP